MSVTVRRVAKVLRALSWCSTAREVAARAGVSKPSAERYLNALEEVGLVMSSPDPEHQQRLRWERVL